MNLGTLVVLLILTATVGAIAFKLIKDKKAGRHICGGDCSKCHGCAHSVAPKK
ncbi:MAG: FeoB-associated Cys-rich membrane protein [Candidatus Ornithomonoglobus sp.]